MARNGPAVAAYRMTVIAYRDGIMAADSRVSVSTEGGGDRIFKCEKLYRKTIKEKRRRKFDVIIGLAGESAPGLVFLDWYGSGKEPPSSLIDGDADFTGLLLRPDGLFEVDKYCRPEKIIQPKFYAVGSGAKAALGAMHMGANAATAVAVACKICPHCAPPVVTMRLKG